MPTIRKCVLCKYVYDPRNRAIKMHMFPLCKEIQGKWKKLCNLPESNDVKNKFLCSKHFRAEEFYKPYLSSKSLYLKKFAIPTIRELPEMDSSVLQQSSNMPSTNTAYTSLPAEAVNFVNVPCYIPEDKTVLRDFLSTSKKRRFMEPRYINEIKTQMKARRVIGMVKRHASTQAKKIKQLQDQRRKLFKKGRFLKDMIAYLKQKTKRYQRRVEIKKCC